jgi:hypothetical protein
VFDEKDSGVLSFLCCADLTVFVGAVNVREESSDPHLCAGLNKSVAHGVGGSSTLVGPLSQRIVYWKNSPDIVCEDAAFHNEILVLLGACRIVNCVVRATRG